MLHSPRHTTPNVTLRPQPKGLVGWGILDGPLRSHPPPDSLYLRNGGGVASTTSNEYQTAQPLSSSLNSYLAPPSLGGTFLTFVRFDWPGGRH